MNHLSESELHAAAEGVSADAPAVEQHLASCVDCREEVDRLSALLARAASMPREIEPPADLWPDIRARMQASRAASREPRIAPRVYLWLAAAAVLLVIASSAVTTLILRGGDQPVVAGHDERMPDSLGGDFRTVSDEYDRMDRDLAALLASQREKLLPETVEKVERNLAIIDQAIAEIRQALAEDPNNQALRQLLKASYNQKAALLRQVSQS